MKYFWLIGGLGLLASPVNALQIKNIVVVPVLSSTVTASGQPIVLPQKDVQVLVSMYQIAPGAIMPVHKHPYPRYGYVLAGTLKVTDTQTGESKIYRSGDFIIETIGRWHQGANIGSTPAKLLVIDQVEKGQINTVLLGKK